MTPEEIIAYDRSRDFSAKAVRSVCYAPHANLFFDTHGNVRACCWNWDHPLGNAQTQTIDEIWGGAQAELLRRALEKYSFECGCKFCDTQTLDGWTAGAAMRNFDEFRIITADVRWPKRMEFSISNVCNLECVMCSGIYSSAIRSRREHRPPLPKAYSAEFIESLRKYLPHLEIAKFLGGEPFLISEYYTIWEMMVEEAPRLKCHVTTNGTQYNSRVEKFMETLDFSFAVSLDGATKETVESIRVNANFDEQLIILKRFRDYTRERKTNLSLTFCFMRQNWHEFGDFCLFADEWGCNVGVNTVNWPPEFSVNKLPPEELRKIVDGMEAQAGRLESLLKRNRAVWFAELERLRRKYASGGRTFAILGMDTLGVEHEGTTHAGLHGSPELGTAEGAPKTPGTKPRMAIFERDPVLFYQLRPHALAEMHVFGRRVVMDVDLAGCRPVIGQPAASEKTLAAYGCACTYGVAIAASETFCSLLQTMFPKWRVENRGVPGYSTAQNLIKLERETHWKKAEFVTFCWIDQHLGRNVAAIPWVQKISESSARPATGEAPSLSLPRATLDSSGALQMGSVGMPRRDLLGMDFSDFVPDPYYLDLVCFRLFERANAIVTGYGGHFFVTTLQGKLSAGLADRLADSGIPVVDASLSGDEYTCLPDDPNPSALAHQIYAGRIRDYLLQHTGKQRTDSHQALLKSA